MKPVNCILRYAGVVAIPVYIAFMYVSHTHNRQINPLEFWLSDYGNPLMNPSGAAILPAFFYIGMYRRYRRDHTARKFNPSYTVAQACISLAKWVPASSGIFFTHSSQTVRENISVCTFNEKFIWCTLANDLYLC